MIERGVTARAVSPGAGSTADEHAKGAQPQHQLNAQLVAMAEQVASLQLAVDNGSRHAKRLEAILEDVRWQLYRRDSRSFRARFKPKLFILRQYDPQPLRLPSRVVAAPHPAPSIAIVTPVYNQARWVAHALESVLGQRYQPLQYVVQDGGSTDGTLQVVERYRNAFIYESGPDGGQTQAINRGFAKVSGEIMGWLNGDDILLPGALAYVARYFQDHPQVDLIYGHRIVVDRDGGQIGHWILPPHDAEALKWADYVPQETMFWRRRVWDAVGPLDESFRFAMDWEFLLRVQEKGFRLQRVPRFLGCFRVHEEQKTGSLHDVYEQEAARIRSRSLGGVVSYLQINQALRAYLRRHVLFERAFKLKLLRY